MIYIFEHKFGCDFFLILNGKVVYHSFNEKSAVQRIIDVSEIVWEIDEDLFAEMDAIAYHSEYVAYLYDMSVSGTERKAAPKKSAPQKEAARKK